MLEGEKVTLRAVKREHAWLAGRYVDNVLMGVLRREWIESGGG